MILLKITDEKESGKSIDNVKIIFSTIGRMSFYDFEMPQTDDLWRRMNLHHVHMTSLKREDENSYLYKFIEKARFIVVMEVILDSVDCNKTVGMKFKMNMISKIIKVCHSRMRFYISF